MSGLASNKRYSAEQIIHKLHEADVLLGQVTRSWVDWSVAGVVHRIRI